MESPRGRGCRMVVRRGHPIEANRSLRREPTSRGTRARGLQELCTWLAQTFPLVLPVVQTSRSVELMIPTSTDSTSSRSLLHPILNLDSPARNFFEEGFGGHVSLLQDRATLADRARAHHLQDDRRGEGGGAHHGAHVALRIVVVDHGEGGDPAFEFSAKQAADS